MNTQKLKLIETLFLPDWNTIAHICEGGKIYIQLAQGRFLTKEQVRTDLTKEQVRIDLGSWNEEFYKERELLFDDLYNYYKENYESI